MRPRIGISAYWREASWGPWTAKPACLAPQGYVEAVDRAGGMPLLVPPLPEMPGFADEALAALDGLVLTGGDDVDAARYGAEPHPTADAPNRRRDAAELALLEAALARRLPVLGVCRGFQLLNIAYGGALDQHLDDRDDVEGDVHLAGSGTWTRHPVAVTGGRLEGLVPDGAAVRSHHHQGIATVGEGLLVTARASDGTVEGLEDPALPFCVGVLWHPEEDASGDGLPLFRALVEAAAATDARASAGA